MPRSKSKKTHKKAKANQKKSNSNRRSSPSARRDKKQTENEFLAPGLQETFEVEQSITEPQEMPEPIDEIVETEALPLAPDLEGAENLDEATEKSEEV